MPAGLLLGLMPLPEPPSPPRAATGEVLIQDRAIEMPQLPGDLRAARKAYPARRTAILQLLEDLSRHLQETYGTLPPGSQRGYTLPAQAGREAQVLADLLRDDTYAALEAGVFDAWVRWQTALLRAGVEHPVEGSRITSSFHLMAATRHLLRPASAPASAAVTYELLVVDGFDYEGRGSLVHEARALAARHLPELARAWAPLAGHLNRAALAMMDLERSLPPDPSLRTLALQARVNLLERCRSALWFALSAWAHMASEPGPPPLPPTGRDRHARP